MAKGHDCRGGFSRAHAGKDRRYTIAVHAEIVKSLRKRDYAVEMITLYPILKLPRLVARVGAPLEHRDDDDLDWNRRGSEPCHILNRLAVFRVAIFYYKDKNPARPRSKVK
jgi:hypothetical protein